MPKPAKPGSHVRLNSWMVLDGEAPVFVQGKDDKAGTALVLGAPTKYHTEARPGPDGEPMPVQVPDENSSWRVVEYERLS